MDFDFKKARKHKQKQDKARSTHRHHPQQKTVTPDQKLKCSDDSHPSGAKGHATPLKTKEKSVSYTETDPAQFQHLRRETEDLATLTETKSYSHRIIVNNWEPYQLPPDTLEDQMEEPLDFETIVKSLSDFKGHMKLSHEQSWGNERTELHEDIFNIDINKLCESLEKVPFHVRQNIPASLFTPEQLAVFEQDADEARKQGCLWKSAPKEDSISQNLPVVSAYVSSTTETNDSKPFTSISCTPVATETTVTTANQFVKEFLSTKAISESKSSKISAKAPETADIAEKNMESPVGLRSDELDLDFLLSLDEGIPDKPKHSQQIDTLGTGSATISKGSGSENLDVWLDDLLDD